MDQIVIEPFKVSVTTFSDVDWDSYRPVRIGVIPYIINSDYPYWILGVDYEHSEIASFSGGARYRSGDDDAIAALSREWKEETLNIFGDLNRDNIPEASIVLRDENNEMCLVLVKFNISDFTPYYQLFHQRLAQTIEESSESEMSNIIIMNNESFVDMLVNKTVYQLHNGTQVPMYSVLRDFLSANLSFLELI